MAAKETTLNELGEMLSHVVGHMATKDDIAETGRTMVTKEDLREELLPSAPNSNRSATTSMTSRRNSKTSSGSVSKNIPIMFVE